ncbi:hypothetical protein DSO57_1011893 [Entomophthora muscae]|uniref:Uncharacterized protein n=1 Tax=Entomophthora muscae TaxID=34485 RepID=A0ACC2TT95_9FUNG|nr:hypothetical protein DSO57_1011893 [Entomophthora muscae]
MERFNQIFNKVFVSSKKAILYCQNLAHLCGFSVRIRTSKSTTIYIVCSREGRPELNRETSRKRSRCSERCNCDWRIVLFCRTPTRWEFRSGKRMEHNHNTVSPELIANLHSPLPSIHSLDLPPNQQQ